MKLDIATSFFNSQRLLEVFYNKGRISPDKIKRLVFSELYKVSPFLPDHSVKNTLQGLWKDSSHSQLVFSNLDELAEQLYFRGNEVYVKSAEFERWQNIILELSPLQIIAYKIYKKTINVSHTTPEKLIVTTFNRTTIPTIYEPSLNFLIEKNGLDENHMHLNGSTEPDFIWLDALHKPIEFYKEGGCRL